MMQVVSKLRLATEHSNAVIGIIAYQPLSYLYLLTRLGCFNHCRDLFAAI